MINERWNIVATLAKRRDDDFLPAQRFEKLGRELAAPRQRTQIDAAAGDDALRSQFAWGLRRLSLLGRIEALPKFLLGLARQPANLSQIESAPRGSRPTGHFGFFAGPAR